MLANADTRDDPLQAVNLNGEFAQRRPAGGAPMLRQDHVDCNSSGAETFSRCRTGAGSAPGLSADTGYRNCRARRHTHRRARFA